jgi:hypothetical protein
MFMASPLEDLTDSVEASNLTATSPFDHNHLKATFQLRCRGEIPEVKNTVNTMDLASK